MIDFSRIRFDGELNEQNGLRFYVSRSPLIVSLQIEPLRIGKRRISITILQEPNHNRPHVHFDGHNASFAIDNGDLLAGHCDNLTHRTIRRWICRHRPDLQQLWDYVQKGGDHQASLKSIREDKDFEDFGFNGQKPKQITRFKGFLIWHDDELNTGNQEDGITEVVCDGNLFVGIPYGVKDEGISFKSINGKVEKRRI